MEGAIVVAGGVRAVARLAQVDPSNLSKFLKYGAGLSSDSFDRLERCLGKIDGVIDSTKVIVLRPTRINQHLADALRWYFPDGAEVARASWSGMGWERIKKMVSLDLAPEVYGIRCLPDKRALVLPPAGLMFPRDLFAEANPKLCWRGGEPERADMQFENATPWIKGEIDIATFDEAWPGLYFDPGPDELLEEVRRLKLSWSEAIRRINYNK